MVTWIGLRCQKIPRIRMHPSVLLVPRVRAQGSVLVFVGFRAKIIANHFWLFLDSTLTGYLRVCHRSVARLAPHNPKKQRKLPVI